MVAFPLKISANNRYLVDQNNVPIPIFDYAIWCLSCVSSTSDLTNTITKLQSFGINSVHVASIVSGLATNVVSTDRDGNLPFTLNQSGGTYTGAWGTADVSSYNPAYWNNLVTVITTLENAGMVAMFLPCYLGYQGGDQGIATDMIGTYGLSGGTAKIQAFANYVAGLFTQSNIIWMAYGDDDPRNQTNGDVAHATFWNKLVSAATQSPLLVGGHFPFSIGLPTAPNNTDSLVSSIFNINTCYMWNSHIGSTSGAPVCYTDVLTGSEQTGPIVPTMGFDSAMYENSSPPGIDSSPNGVRNRWWWSVLSGTMGVFFGNDICSNCGSTTGGAGTFTYANMDVSAGFLSTGHAQLAVSISIFGTLPWYHLLPSGVGTVPTLITSGQGTYDSGAPSSTTGMNWIQAAADPNGSLLLAYVPIAYSGTFTVVGTAVNRPYNAYWIDPTDGTKTFIARYYTSSSQSFTPPGTNSYGSTDWLLYLEGNTPNCNYHGAD